MLDDMLHMTEWPNGEKEFSPPTDNEMARRQNELRGWKATNNVDAALFTSYHCINDYSGWLYCYFGRRYGMGIDQKTTTTADYGREAGLDLREDIDTVLKPGMVVSMEPMVMNPEGHPGAGGYREHDSLVIGADGAKNITGVPFGPEHNIVGKG